MYKDKKIILFVFASLDLKKSIDRLKKQASASNFYDLIKVITPDDFDYETKLKVKKFMKDNKRGYGYWFWKPFFLSKILKEINYGDVVHYIDIGCHINKAGSKRFYEYLDFLNDKNRWLLAFQYHVENIKFSDEIEFQNREEFKYTKSDLLDYFNSLDVDEITITPQFWAGSFFIKKHPESEKFINNWNKVFENNFHLIDDTPSKIPNLPGFIENRHDQSVFSLLCKTNSIYSFSAYESEWGEKNNSRTWEHLSNYPIIAKRDLEYNIFKRFINRQIKNFKRKKSYFFRQ